MQGEHVVDAAPREKLGLTPRSRRDQLDLFLRPTTSLGDGELPFSKLSVPPCLMGATCAAWGSLEVGPGALTHRAVSAPLVMRVLMSSSCP